MVSVGAPFFVWGGSLSLSEVVVSSVDSVVSESELLSSGSQGSLVSVSLLSLVSVSQDVESCSE